MTAKFVHLNVERNRRNCFFETCVPIEHSQGKKTGKRRRGGGKSRSTGHWLRLQNRPMPTLPGVGGAIFLKGGERRESKVYKKTRNRRGGVSVSCISPPPLIASPASETKHKLDCYPFFLNHACRRMRRPNQPTARKGNNERKKKKEKRPPSERLTRQN
jgi:hypothetical protein